MTTLHTIIQIILSIFVGIAGGHMLYDWARYGLKKKTHTVTVGGLTRFIALHEAHPEWEMTLTLDKKNLLKIL